MFLNLKKRGWVVSSSFTIKIIKIPTICQGGQILRKDCYRQFLSRFKPLFENEAKCEAIDILMQIKLIFIRKVLLWVSFSKWKFLELRSGLLLKFYVFVICFATIVKDEKPYLQSDFPTGFLVSVTQRCGKLLFSNLFWAWIWLRNASVPTHFNLLAKLIKFL